MDRSVRRGSAIIIVALIAIAVILFTPKQHTKPHPPNNNPWHLVSYAPDNKYGTYLGNGFISTRIMGDGVGSQDGRPLPCYMAGLYEDEKLIPTPTWSDLRFYDGKQRFKIDINAPYKQVLNMKTGILTTYAVWRAGSRTLDGKIEVIVSRAVPNAGLIRAEVVPNFDGILRVSSPISTSEDRAGKRTKSRVVIYKTIVPFSAQKSGVHTKRGDRLVISVWASVFAHSNQLSAGSNATPVYNPARFISDHKAAWAKLWERDIIIDGPKKDQQVIHSCMFYLLQSVRDGSQWSIPPMGLSANSFSGHVFWDADTWMFPALILQYPELARSIVDYRYNTLSGAIANAKSSGYLGAEYAWESGYTGKDDTPAAVSYRNERHINGDVALAQWQYYLATNDLNWLKTRGYFVIKATADYWVSRAVFNNGRYEIKQVVPPDETAEIVNNSVYTNAIAQINLDIAIRAAQRTGRVANPKWQKVARGMYIPFDAKAQRFIAFDGYRGLKAKQADSQLLAYPLQFVLNGRDMTAIYRNTLNYYAPKVMPKGPAMTASAHSVITARLGECDRAYKSFIRSYKPYMRGPMNYFNETPSKFRDNYCFITGCAGPIQAAIFGLGGAKMNYFPDDPSKADLTYKPCLPKQWKSLTITGIKWHGKTFDLTVKNGNVVEFSRR